MAQNGFCVNGGDEEDIDRRHIRGCELPRDDQVVLKTGEVWCAVWCSTIAWLGGRHALTIKLTS